MVKFGSLAVFGAHFLRKRRCLHLDHVCAQVVFNVLLAFAATCRPWGGHKAGNGDLLAAFFAAAGAAVPQERHKALEFTDALGTAAGAAMGYVGRLKMAGRVQFVRAVLGLKNIAQQCETVHFFVQFALKTLQSVQIVYVCLLRRISDG